MITLARVNAAKDVELIPLSKKPDAMLNWQLAQKLSSTMPVEKIVFYQVNEGHYSFVTKDNYRWLQEYTLDKKPKLGELMILSELSVFDALFERSISIDTALSEMWIKINGPKRERELVTEWLRENFA
ncbi:hypothetical protein JCM19241_3290 [Vibrio ishigakensis]|uniref:Uncharacterized protein n=1 Tax=Vibrio ishigakensis TaxID=1481914 RepID=A0A0B8QJV1_9VIBR|nr:hypothetical protein JCM19241_3290 [Vibrio ishigakensis]